MNQICLISTTGIVSIIFVMTKLISSYNLKVLGNGNRLSSERAFTFGMISLSGLFVGIAFHAGWMDF